MNEVRQGIVQAGFGEGAYSILSLEIVIISVVAGLYFESWWVFGGVFLGLIFAQVYWLTAFVSILALTATWAYGSYRIINLIGELGKFEPSLGAFVVIGTITSVCSFGVHLCAVRHLNDYV